MAMLRSFSMDMANAPAGRPEGLEFGKRAAIIPGIGAVCGGATGCCNGWGAGGGGRAREGLTAPCVPWRAGGGPARSGPVRPKRSGDDGSSVRPRRSSGRAAPAPWMRGTGAGRSSARGHLEKLRGARGTVASRLRSGAQAPDQRRRARARAWAGPVDAKNRRNEVFFRSLRVIASRWPDQGLQLCGSSLAGVVVVSPVSLRASASASTAPSPHCQTRLPFSA